MAMGLSCNSSSVGMDFLHSFISGLSQPVVLEWFISTSGEADYGPDYEIWADFWPDGNTEKKLGADYGQLLRPFLSCFRGQKKL